MKYCIALAGLTGIIYGATLNWWEAGLVIVAILIVVGLSARDSRRRLGPKPTGPCGPPRPPGGQIVPFRRAYDWDDIPVVIDPEVKPGHIYLVNDDYQEWTK
jgi:hypothetical protein